MFQLGLVQESVALAFVSVLDEDQAARLRWAARFQCSQFSKD